MIISKKKFERLVEEEVNKRMAAAEERRWQHEQIDRIQDGIDRNLASIYKRLEQLEVKDNNKPLEAKKEVWIPL